MLEFGTVNWELDVIRHHGLDKARGLPWRSRASAAARRPTSRCRAGPWTASSTTTFGCRASARRRAADIHPVFQHGRRADGAAGFGIASLADLAGKKIGVAGGPLDKSWLLLQGLAAKRHGMDLAAEAEPVYGAPPLLNEKVQTGELDAVLNYWHFAARLDAKGYEELVSVEEAISELGVASVPPQLGYVFPSSSPRAPELIAAFADASRAAKELLKADAEWERIRPLTKAEDDATFEALKRRFREGIIERWGEPERADAAPLYAILAELGGEQLVGGAMTVAPGTFWPGVMY